MPEVQRLYIECKRLAIDASQLKVLLTLHPKKAEVLRQLGVLIQRTGPQTRALVDTRFLRILVDLLALHFTIESDTEAAGAGHALGCKAVAVTSAVLALTSNDTLPGMAGIPTSLVFASLFSTSFRNQVAIHGGLVRRAT